MVKAYVSLDVYLLNCEKVMKKNLLLFIFCINTLVATTNTISRVIPDPKHTKFAFDLQDVVLQRDIENMKQLAFKKEHLPLLVHVCNLPLMSRVLRLAARKATAEEYVLLFDEFDRPELSQLVQIIANEQKPNMDVVAIIKELKELGYQIDMASNIGAQHLIELEKKDELKSIFALFNNKFFVDYKQKTIQKPHEQYFKNYLKKYNKKHKTIIFIDDQKNNVTNAQKTGMIGLRFSTAEQLRKDLQELGVLKKD